MTSPTVRKAAGAAFVAILMTACGGAASNTTTTTSPTATTVPTTAPPAEAIVSDEGVTEVGDGRYIGFITTADDGSVTFDLAVWFTGDAANEAATEDGAPEVPVPNDFYIRNLDESLITTGVSEAVSVTSAWYNYDADQDLESDPITYAEFVEAMTGDVDDVRANLRVDPWWITIEGGEVVALDEQYVP